LQLANSRAGAICGAGLSGLLLGLASLPLGLGPLALVALVPLLRVIGSGASPLRSAGAGYLAGLLYFGVGLAWLPLVDGYAGRVPLAWALGVLGAATLLFAFAGLIAWLHGRDRLLAFALAPVVWIALEQVRVLGPFGSPWLWLGYALGDWPALASLAACGGVACLSLWIVACNVLVATARGPLAAAGAALVMLALPLGLDALRAEPEPSGSLAVAAVQPARSAGEQRRPEHFDRNLRELVALTDALAPLEPDLIVWPESAWERVVGPAGDAFLSSLGNSLGAPLVTGAWRRSERGTLHNAAFVVAPGGELRHVSDKVYPVPVFERAPGSEPAYALARAGLWPGHFEPGGHVGLFDVERADGTRVRVGVLVCIDSIYPWLARELRRRGAQLLVEVSNEIVTGEWSARQHAQAARLRAIETGAPLVRVSNAGPSAWIDARGRVVATTHAGRARTRVVAVALAVAPTPWVRFGDAPVFVLGLLPAGGLALRRRRPGSHEPDDVLNLSQETPS
jgi:apolipoprotein N-acyltransferase